MSTHRENGTHGIAGDLRDFISDIRRLFDNTEVYCFVGAGLSKLSDGTSIVGWGELLDRMRVHLEKEGLFVSDSLNRFQSALDDEDYKLAGQIYKESRIAHESKQKLFDELFLQDKRCHPIHYELIRIGFNGIFTTNYDRLLEDAYACVMGRSVLPYLPRDLESQFFRLPDSFFIAKLHGDAGRWDTIVIGGKDYDNCSWSQQAKERVNGKALIVLGISGRDDLINKFLVDLDPSTRVFVCMSRKTVDRYKESLRSFHGSIPEHILPISVSHEELPELILSIRPGHISDHLEDCRWAEMPSQPHEHLDFGESTSAIRRFLFSDVKALFLNARPGNGLSSFISQSLRDRASAGDAIVFRLEAKEFLPWDAYVLHLLATTPDPVYEAYRQRRYHATSDWTIEAEAVAVSEALWEANRPIVVALEHVHRLPEESWEFLPVLAEKSPTSFKLILATAYESTPRMHVDQEMTLESVPADTARFICRQRRISDSVFKSIINLKDDIDLNTFVVAACAVQNGITTVDHVASCVARKDDEGIYRLAIESLGSDRDLLIVAKASALFRTPRDISWLKRCTQLDGNLRSHLEKLCDLGLLIPPSKADGKYAMSTTAREKLCNLLPWTTPEREELSSQIGNLFEETAERELKEGRFSRRAMCRVIPFLSSALYHYREAGDRESYLTCVCKVSKHLTHMYHSAILEHWLKPDRIPGGDCVTETDFMTELVRGDIARVKARPSSYKVHLDAAEKVLESIGDLSKRYNENRNKLRWNKGIVHTMMRDYPEALKYFRECELYTDDIESADYYKPRLRVIQTLFSLGKLREAEEQLRVLQKQIDRIGDSVSSTDLYYHSSAMLHRHRSTLSTLRLIFFERHPKTESITQADLYNQAIVASKECYRYSELLKDLRLGEPDITGMGVARLKEAQAHYGAHKPEAAIEPALEGAKMLAAFPDNRWWRICCHDYAAKALSMCHQLPQAEAELRKAEELFGDSADEIRYCELQFSHGLIELRKGNIEEAIDYLIRSTSFKKESPCIMAVHLSQLALALIDARRNIEAQECLSKIGLLPIEW